MNDERRYLTPAAQEAELACGYGKLDAGVRPYLDRLNALPGVCSVQSCTGHVHTKGDGSRYVESGALELRLDRVRTAAFYNAMPFIASMNGIEDVAISWRPGYQICHVVFRPGLFVEVATAVTEALDR